MGAISKIIGAGLKKVTTKSNTTRKRIVKIGDLIDDAKSRISEDNTTYIKKLEKERTALQTELRKGTVKRTKSMTPRTTFGGKKKQMAKKGKFRKKSTDFIKHGVTTKPMAKKTGKKKILKKQAKRREEAEPTADELIEQLGTLETFKKQAD